LSTLLLKFKIILNSESISDNTEHPGPLFHRWLPDGMDDAIILNNDQNTELKIWFERFGFVDGSLIEFDYHRQEVDPNIIPQQAIIEAGPLMGLLEIREISEEELIPLTENSIGDENFITFGKKVVNKLIYPSVARFIRILRTNYCQYWIQDLEKWDSRRESLGRYCQKRLHLKWSLDGGDTWSDFVPNKPIGPPCCVEITLGFSEIYLEYITSEDWQKLRKAIQDEYDPTTAANFLARTNQFLDQGNLKHALIEGVSAFELAINEFFRHKMIDDDSKSLRDGMKSFMELSLRAQIISISLALGNIPVQDIKNAVNVVNMRNKLIHEGRDPPKEAKDEICGLLNIIKELLSGPRFKFPKSNPGNLIMSNEDWKSELKDLKVT
jgi:hypothetical protein